MSKESLRIETPRSLVAEFAHRNKKSLGQHFLIDESVTSCIAEAALRFKPEILLEIGPGPGALTIELLKSDKKLCVVEKDDVSAAFQQKKFGDLDHFTLIHGDILTCDLPDDIFPNGVVVGNLPYNISTQIYFRFASEERGALPLIFMFQKEVAQRMSAEPGTKAYGALSVVAQYYHRIETLIDVAPRAFRPAPKVDSRVLVFYPKTRELPREQEDFFVRFVRDCFAFRRKTLSNNLKHYFGREKSDGIIEKSGLNPSCRAENLVLRDFLRLGQAFREENRNQCQT